jgi:hypothetical protein
VSGDSGLASKSKKNSSNTAFEGIVSNNSHSMVSAETRSIRFTFRIVVLVSIAALVTASLTQSIPGVSAQTVGGIDLTKEYASGLIPPAQNQGVGFWYSWVNYNGTKMIFLALHNPTDRSPVRTLLGEEFNTTSGDPIFVGNILQVMEVYNGSTSNGILNSLSEINYFFVVNSSATDQLLPITKAQIGNATHYDWGVQYGGIDAFLLVPTPPPSCGGGLSAFSVTLSYLNLTYDYAIEKNTTFLKTSYHLGNLTTGNPVTDLVLDTTLHGLSLDLLYTTTTLSPKQYTVLADGQIFNSSQTGYQPTKVNLAQVKIGNALPFEYRFADNYSLGNSPTLYPALYTAATTGTVSPNFLCSQSNNALLGMQSFLQQLLPEIGQPLSNPNLNYTSSSLIYRIAYPMWNNLPITHDPTFVAHFSATSSGGGQPIIPPGAVFPVELVALAGFTGVLAVILAVRRFPRIGTNIPLRFRRALSPWLAEAIV